MYVALKSRFLKYIALCGPQAKIMENPCSIPFVTPLRQFFSSPQLMTFIGMKNKNQQRRDEPDFHHEHTVEIHSIPLYYQMTVEVMPGRALFEGKWQ